MKRLFSMNKRKVGVPPGTLLYHGDSQSKKTKITVFDYDQDHYNELEVSTDDCCRFKDERTVSWINVDGVHDVAVIEKLGKSFDIHGLTLEDILNTAQRPKFEEFESYVFIVTKMLRYDHVKDEINIEQVSIVFNETCVLSFQESEGGDVFTALRERIRQAKGRVRRLGADYLAYSLLDAIVDNYFLILEALSERIEKKEEELAHTPDNNILHDIHKIKGEIIYLRRAVWPLRDVMSNLYRSELKMIKEGTKIYFRDLYDHIAHIIDTVETFRDMVSGLLDLYLSSMSYRMNEVMKVLTLTATIFIPLTFVVGVYGMNFNTETSRWNMPELNMPYGYVFVWIIMICVAGGMLLFFKKKKWF
jgi:magnesium transporter